MTNRIRTLVVASVLFLSAGFTAASHGQQMGAGGPPPGRPGPGGGAPPSNGGFGGPGMSGRDAVLPSDFTRSRGQDWPQPGGSRTPPGSPPSRTPDDDLDKSVPLNYAVSMVQERFNATAVKTDTVLEGGQWVYRIRLLSADKSKVWTVSVDARTGRVN